MYELTASYGATDWIDVVFGVRINDLSAELNGLRLPITGAASHVWADPIIGARLRVPGLGNWRLSARLDTGVFGVGSSYAVQIYPTLGYDFSPRFALAGGFRFLKMKYETGEGAGLFVYDIATYGPVLGFVFRFGD